MKLFLDFFNNIYNNRKLLAISIFFSSILFSIIFLIFFSAIGPSQHGDLPGDYFNWYEPIANNILQGKGIGLDGKVFRNIPPGFSVILSGIFTLSELVRIDKINLIIVFNVFFIAIASCLLFLIAKEIFNKKIALISSLLWMSYPFNLWFVKQPHTEMPFIPLFFLGIFFYILTLKKKSLNFSFWAGVFLGLAALVRLISLYFPFFLGLLFFILLKDYNKRKFLLAGVLLIGSLLAIFPWGFYAFLKTGGLIPFSDELGASGPVVYGVTVLIAPMTDENNRVFFSEDIVALIERVKAEDIKTEFEFLQFFGRELIIRPTPVLKLIGLKLSRSWYATSQEWWEKEILMVQLFYLMTGFLGIIYAVKFFKDKLWGIILLLCIVFYFWAMTFLNVSILRFMVPAMALVIIFSAVSINVLIERLFKKRHNLL